MINTVGGFGVSALVRAELSRHDWGRLRCGCGKTAEHIPLTFETVLQAETPTDMLGHTLDNHIEHQTNLFEVSVPAVQVVLAALAGEVPSLARVHLMDMLWYMAGGDAHWTEVGHGRGHLGNECRARIREGLWVVAHVGMTGTADEAESAADIVEWSEIHEVRSSFYQDLLRQRALAKTKRKHRR
ncbi:hypothetical protein GCM10010442_20160 [Kitasatospora kifunensis]